MDKMTFALLILAVALVVMSFATKLRAGKSLVLTIGFFMLVTGGFASYANWLPQTRGEVPPELDTSKIDVNNMPTDKLADLGASIIFDDPKALKGAGKGQ